MFAIVLTQWAKSETRRDKCVDEICFDTYFGTIGKSLLSLLQILVYDDTFALIRPTIEETWYMGAFLILFICIGSFTVLNMLIGVICEIVGVTTSKEKEAILRARVGEVFAQLDADSNGSVSQEEFTVTAHSQLAKLGIEPGLVKSAFDIIDVDNNGKLELDEFIQMIFKLLHPPEAQDLLKIHQKLDRISDSVGVSGDILGSSSSSPKPSTMTPSLTKATCKHDQPNPQRLEELLQLNCDRIVALERAVKNLSDQLTRSGAVVLPSSFEAQGLAEGPEELGLFLRMELAQLSAQMARQSEHLTRLERTCAFCEGKDMARQAFGLSSEVAEDEREVRSDDQIVHREEIVTEKSPELKFCLHGISTRVCRGDQQANGG